MHDVQGPKYCIKPGLTALNALMNKNRTAFNTKRSLSSIVVCMYIRRTGVFHISKN